jgi:hypothetical protein
MGTKKDRLKELLESELEQIDYIDEEFIYMRVSYISRALSCINSDRRLDGTKLSGPSSEEEFREALKVLRSTEE